MAVILDSDICVEIIRENQYYTSVFNENFDVGLKVTFMTASELLYGSYLSSRGEAQINATNAFLHFFDVIVPDINSCHQFGQMKAALQKNGNLIPDADLIIASLAIANDLPLVSNNQKHFERLTAFGLRLESW